VPSEKRLRQREGRQARQEELRYAQQKSRQRRQYLFIGGGIAILALAFWFFALRGSGKKSSVATKSSTTSTAPSTTAAPATTPTTAANQSVATIAAPANTGCPKLDGSSPHYTKFAAAPPMCISAAKKYTITFQTDVGTITAQLDPAKAPKTVNSFVYLTGYHYFDGIVFHRVIPDFVIQGGDPTGTGSGGPGYQFADELPKAGEYKNGSLAMANSGPNTNGSQFFIIDGSQGTALTPNYSLFGQVTTGMDVVNKIIADGDSSGTPKVLHRMVKVTVSAA
jgi:cyclophilin family peptidyl-prolyl cis-trans isomerase